MDRERGQSKFRLNAMPRTDIRGNEGRQNTQLNQMNNLNVLPSNLVQIGSVQFCHFSAYCRMYLTQSTGCAYSCSILLDVPYTVHWLCIQLQHTAGCTLHGPLAVPTAAAHCWMYLTQSTGCAYSCSILLDVPYTFHWLCLQLQHTAGCTLHGPLAVPTAAAHCWMYLTQSTGCAYSCTLQGLDFFSQFQGFHFSRPRNVQVSEKCQVVPQ